MDEPTADWTWDDFQAAAKALTDASKQQFGFAFPIDASEDTVWHYDAMLWEAGGDILNADNTQAAFNSEAGVQALTTLQTMAVTDQSVFLDQQNVGKIDQLFNAGKIGMLVTGPWALSSYPDVNYGVQIMPMYEGGSHATIAGPDMWVMFDNGDGRGDAAWQFMTWFTAAEQVKQDSMTSGHLPIRNSVVDEPGFLDEFDAKFPGEGLFAENLANVTKARPVITSYDQISQIMGTAVVDGDARTSRTAGGARRRREPGQHGAGRRVESCGDRCGCHTEPAEPRPAGAGAPTTWPAGCSCSRPCSWSLCSASSRSSGASCCRCRRRA